MEGVLRYRAFAAECLRISQDASDSRTKLALLDMAQTWIRLAEEAEKRKSASQLTATFRP
jgi:hypothetical protein